MIILCKIATKLLTQFMAVKFYQLSALRGHFRFITLLSYCTYKSLTVSHSRPAFALAMPPKRKAGATKAKPAEEPQAEEVETKKSRATKKTQPAEAVSNEKPKTAKLKAAKSRIADDEQLETEQEEVANVELPKRQRRQVQKAPLYKEENADDDYSEKDSKRKVAKSAAKKSARTEKASEETESKPKGKGRSRKAEEPAASKPKTLMNATETNYESLAFQCDKVNSHGKKANFCIASWNVDGLRAWLKKDGLRYLDYEKPDIFCIQETKCSEDKLPPEVKDLDGYKQYWRNSDKEGYAGVGLFSRKEPLSVKYGVGVEEHDDEGRCITAEYEKFYVVSVYVPNAGRKLVTLPKRLEWNKAFKAFINQLDKKKPVIVCGDMNVAHTEIDLANPKTNTKNAGFTKEERDGMTEFLGDGYVDTFRKFYPDQTGAYTFWTYMMKSRSKNVGWRLDYFIASERLENDICDSVIRSEVLGSDHCPIALFLHV